MQAAGCRRKREAPMNFLEMRKNSRMMRYRKELPNYYDSGRSPRVTNIVRDGSLGESLSRAGLEA